MAENEIQVSFDVESLFPNVPMNETMQILREWFTRNRIEPEEIDVLINLTTVCMQENWFQFNGKFYKQNFGCSMGSPLSPFLADLFMSHLETKLKIDGILPRVWLRYVDDVWAIIKKHHLRTLLNSLNNTGFPTIKFTHEEEKEGKLNFLDISITKSNDTFKFDIFRKPTNTSRYITSNSYHSFKHKCAAFHCMVHRAVNIPMDEETFANEILRIKNIANINGYTEQLIDELVIAHQRKKELRNYTNLSLVRDERSNEEEENIVWASFNHYPPINRIMRNTLKSHNIVMVERSDLKVKHLIGGSKDKIHEHQKSGIYSIKCNDCNQQYIGQSRRAIEKRFKEHTASTQRGEIEKSSIANHMWSNDHNFNISNLKLLQTVNKYHELNALESFYISNNTNLMNENEGPIKDPIFKKINVNQ